MPDYSHQFSTIQDDVRLHALAWDGAPDQTPMIFVPGFINNAYSALRVAAAIAPHRRVFALDLRGRGKSDKPPTGYNIDQHVMDVRQWLAVNKLDKVIFAGHSFGASVALLYAHQFPAQVKKLILLDGGAIPTEIAMQMFRAYYENLTYEFESMEAFVAPYRQIPALQPWTDEAEALIRGNIEVSEDGKARRTVPEYVVQAELSALDLSRWQVVKAIYPTLQVPVLLIRAGMGSFDASGQHLSDDILAEMHAIPNLTVYEMPHTGHTGILTVPDAGRDAALAAFVQA